MTLKLTETRSGEVLATHPLRVLYSFINKKKEKSMLDFRTIHFKSLLVVYSIPEGGKRIATGRVAQTLCWLCERRERGITAQEMSSWALRLSAYIHILRHEHGLDIDMQREHHNGGAHGRYFLLDNVTIHKVRNTLD